MRRRRRPIEMSGALVGWLFADVAIVLMIVFAGTRVVVPSSVPTTTTSTTTTTTTSTTVASTTVPSTTVPPGGVELEALETGAVAIGSVPGDGVAARLEDRLNGVVKVRVVAAVPEKVGVILIYAGARTDGNVVKAKERACLVREALLRDWSRIDEGRVYFKCFHDLNLENGFVKFSLFPIIDSSFTP